ncbi:TonB-dependent receptor [Cellvibrio mixtus]|uniref:TonB-dependent receptor n=1 Tax=Cellvibrio mixtus TaxID=39650 RepID=UPI000AE3F4EE|nr:TonB-dependent receptor [Cellvibrio mixtus]
MSKPPIITMQTGRTRHRPLRRSLKRPLAIACAFLPLLAVPAFAADTDNKIEEIIVTASKRNQSLLDFSGAVSVITNFQNVKNIGDIASQVPGFNIVDAGPRNPAGLVIRGLRIDEIGSNDLGGDGSAVASYVDNIPLQGFFVPPSFSVKDLQQVEVLRGPQGTLYGNASIGGLIRYVTAKPDLEKYSVRVNAEASQTKHSDDLNYDTDLVVNAPLVDDILGMRLLLGKTENAGFIDNEYLLTGPAKDINDDETRQARINLLWQPTENLSLNTMYHYQEINVGDRQATNESFTGDKYSASSRYLQPMEGELQLAGIDAEYELEFATLTASVNHYDYAYHSRADQTDLYIALDPTNEYYNLYEDLSAYNASDVDVVKDSIELRLASADGQAIRWLVGGFYSRDDLDVYMGDYTPGFGEFLGAVLPGGLEYLSTQTETLDEYSLYGEVAYDFTPKWEVSLGGRHFRYDDTLNVCTIGYPTERPPSCRPGDDVSTGVLGKFSTRYKFTDTHSAYFTVAEGYRRGGANALPERIDFSREYDPDTAVNYEIGVRANWFEQRLKLNAALFVNDWRKIQVADTVEGRYPIWINAEDARSQGVELDFIAQINNAFSVQGIYSYTDAELTETVESISAYDGNPLPGSPDRQWSLSLDYAEPFMGVDVDARVGINHIGEIYTALNPDFYNYQKLKSYNTVNARIGVTRSNWRLGAFINNIENTRGITGKRSDETYGDQGKFEYITHPRTIGLSVTYKY